MAVTHRQMAKQYFKWVAREISTGGATAADLQDFMDLSQEDQVLFLVAWAAERLPELQKKQARLTKQLATITIQVDGYTEYTE